MQKHRDILVRTACWPCLAAWYAFPNGIPRQPPLTPLFFTATGRHWHRRHPDVTRTPG
jgi:hypothetical protein